VSSTAWERCPNCSRNTKQDPITASLPTTFTMPLYGKPEFNVFIDRHCAHCESEYRVHYHLVLSDRIVLKKGKEGWK